MILPVRKKLRLTEYSYSSNACYFLTLCTKNKVCILSYVYEDEICLTSIGKIAEKYIQSIPTAYPNVNVDKYVIMPNHIHMLLSVVQDTLHKDKGDIRQSEIIPRLIAAFKRFSNRDIGEKIWQDSYYDHIIRNENDYLIKWNYIDTNPARWVQDDYYVLSRFVGCGDSTHRKS